jgi:hypothetical protein
MRTTLDLPEELLAEALSLSPHTTKTAVIIAALEDMIRKHRIRGLKKYKGRVDVNVDLDISRKRQ